jgi:Rrf2 family protein
MMVEIAKDSGDGAVSLGHIAKRTKISRRYLDQLAQGLKRASLVRGLSGRGGGYQLTRPPEEIHLNDIIEAAIGPINIVECVQQPEVCIKADLCECRWVYAVINQRIAQVLEEISLADLADRAALKSICESLESESTACPAR